MCRQAVLVASLLAFASAAEVDQFPFYNTPWNDGASLDPMSSVRRPMISTPIGNVALSPLVSNTATEAVCEPESDFFERGLAPSLLQHPEFDGSNVKIALGRNQKYFQVDQPFSHAANAMSFTEQYEPEDKDQVTCGSHKAKTCSLCAQGHESGWCNGDCKWEKNSCNPANEHAIDMESAFNNRMLQSKSAQAIVSKDGEKARAKIRMRHGWSGSRIEQAQKERKLELHKEEHEIATATKADKVDVWYVNMDGQKERKNCLERQFKDMRPSVQANRYSAVEFPNCGKAGKTHAGYESCLKEADLGDCFESGIDYAGTGTHGTRAVDEHKIRNAVLSNWCSHKRLFQNLEKENNATTDAAKYVVVLEDDVILDRKYFMKVVQDFAMKYGNRDWDMVQLDPFGHKDKKDFLEHFRGKPVFKPTAEGQCSAYWGFHAVLIKTSALHRVNKWMSNNQAVPIDWLPWRMPHVLAYSALVSRNPEAKLNGGVVVLPAYCSQKVMKSTIGQ